MEKCLDKFGISAIEDTTFQKEYPKEELVVPEHNVPPFGIQPVNNDGPYPITTAPVPDLACKDEAQRIGKKKHKKLRNKM